jgi:bifunctional oligoribonuclease and PAP phosphatase NrnA
MSTNIKTIRRAILKAQTIAISGHVNPDGDSIGSILALGFAFESIGKKVYVLCQDELPQNYRFLPGAERIVKRIKKRVDLAIAVDCSIMELLGKNTEVFKKSKSIFEIDHHEFRKSFGNLQLIDHKAAAVGELVYAFLKKMKIEISKDIAENILTSIIVETNLFKLANVRPFTFEVCRSLLKTGVDYYRLVDKVYGPKTKEAMMLFAICLLKAKFLKEGKIVWSILTNADLVKVGAKDYDADAIANEMNSIKGVEVTVLFREKNKKILRASLRSKGDINVGKIAQECSGGGHFDIAGCYINSNKKAMKQLLSSVAASLN